VSLLRVYGLTHLEEWKWDSSRANRYEQLAQEANPDPTSSTIVEVVDAIPVSQTFDLAADLLLDPEHVKTKTDTQPSVDPIPEHTTIPQDAGIDKSSSPSADAESTPITSNSSQSSSVVSHSPPDASTLQSTSDPIPQTTEVTPSVTVRSPSPAPPSQATPVISLGSQIMIPPPQAGGGESIYRKIMNKIAVLELNATWHARYVEEHAIGVREVLKRLTEEVGRLEGIVRRHSQP
jgi:hypothetical protein